MLQSEPMKSGAGGNWKRFDEKFDSSVVKQTSGISCVSAVGEMLLKSLGINVSQQIILDIIGEPATASSLAKVLNEFADSTETEKWHGTVTDEDSLEILLKRKNWAVILREPLERFGHAVIVDGKTRGGLIKIKDPFDQTSYKMTKADFLNHWGGEVIFYGTVK
jgi:ABC-type bacteriocin/lantibiotic exporter with double-glycine peptidase domain